MVRVSGRGYGETVSPTAATLPAPASLTLTPVSATIRADYPDARATLIGVCLAHGWAVVELAEYVSARGPHLIARFPGHGAEAWAVMQAHLARGVLVRLASLERID